MSNPGISITRIRYNGSNLSQSNQIDDTPYACILIRCALAPLNCHKSKKNFRILSMFNYFFLIFVSWKSIYV